MKKQIPVHQFILWVYQDQKADIVIDRGVGLFPAEKLAAGLEHYNVSGDGCHQVEQTHLLGTRVDYSGRGTAALHPDAELAHDTIKGKTFNDAYRGILLEYGKSAREPDWMGGDRAGIVPIMTKKGRLKYLRDGNRNARACEVRPVVSSSYVEFKRFIYSQWWDALEAFRARMTERGQLQDYDLLPPPENREPWLKKGVDQTQKA